MTLKTRNNNSGFTLIEFLLYLALSTVMVVLVGLLGISALSSGVKARAQSEVQYSAEFLIETIARLVREAESVTLPLRGATSTTLILATADPDTDPTVIELTPDGVTITRGVEAPYTIYNPATRVTTGVVTHEGESGDENLIRLLLTVVSYNPMDRQSLRAERTFTTALRVPYTSTP